MYCHLELSNTRAYQNVGDKFFVYDSAKYTDPYEFRLFDQGSLVAHFKCVNADGGTICFYRSAVFSYNVTNSAYKIRRYSRDNTKDFFVHITGSNFDQLYEIIHTNQ